MIPKDWSFTPLAEILERVRKPVAVENNVIYKEIGIRSHGKGIFYKEETTGEKLGDKSVFWIEPDCFILNIVFAWEQAIAVTTMNEKGMIASHRFPMYKPKQNFLLLDYLLYFFMTPRGKYLLELASPGGAGRNKTLGQAEFLKLEILLPPLPEQRKIVEILNTWDEAIELLEQLITAKHKLKQGLMQQLLTGKKRFKEFEGSEWNETEFGQIVVNTQLGTTRRGVGKGINIALIKMGNMGWGSLNFDKLEYISEENLEGEDMILKSGDFLFNTRNTPELVGKSSVWHEQLPKATFDNNINRIRFPNDVNADFVCFQLSHGIGKQKIRSINSGSTSVSAIYWKNLKKLLLKLPSIEEQNKIAFTLSTADAEISNLEKQLAAYKQQKRGLMQQLLTGKKRVKIEENN